MKHIDCLFRAFADRTRLRVLSILRAEPELCVCDIMTVLRLPQAKTSRHLAYLRKAGLVRVWKQGLWSHYSLAPAQSSFHKSLLDCLANCFQDVPELAQDLERLRLAKGSATCK